MTIRTGQPQSHKTMASALPAPQPSGGQVSEPTSPLDAFQSEFDYLHRSLRRLGVRSEDIEDDLQEVFLVLHRKWTAYDPTRPLRPYLFGIAFRVVSGRKRRNQREVPSLLDEHPAVDLGADQALDAAAARQLLLDALSRVPLARRAVLVMHDLDETPMREVAQVLSIPLFTGYSRLRKARRELEAAVRHLTRPRTAR